MEKGEGLLFTKKGMIIGLLGIIMTLLIIPSSAQFINQLPVCWQKISDCVQNNLINGSAGSLSDSSKWPEFYCCSMIEEQAKTEKQCFCSITQDPTKVYTAAEALTNCKLPSFDVICAASAVDAPPSTPQPPPASGSVPSTPTSGSVPSTPASGLLPSSSGSVPPPPKSKGHIRIIINVAVPSVSALVLILIIVCVKKMLGRRGRENANPAGVAAAVAHGNVAFS